MRRARLLAVGVVLVAASQAAEGQIQLRRPWPDGDFWKPETYTCHNTPRTNAQGDGRNLAVDFYATNRNRPDLYRSADAGEAGQAILAANDGEIYLYLLDITALPNANVEKFDAQTVIQGGSVPTNSFSIDNINGTRMLIDMEVAVDTPTFRSIYVHLQALPAFFTDTGVQGHIRQAVADFYSGAAGNSAAIDTGQYASGAVQLGTTFNWGAASEPHLHFQVFAGTGGLTPRSAHLGTVVDLSDPGQVTIGGEVPLDWSLDAAFPSGTTTACGGQVLPYVVYRFPAMPRRRFALNDTIVVRSAWDGVLAPNVRAVAGGTVLQTIPDGTSGTIVNAEAIPAPIGNTSDWHLWREVSFPGLAGWIAGEYIDPANSLPAPPSLLSPADGTVLAPGTTQETLQWAPVAGANGYDVEVSTGSCGAVFAGGASVLAPVTSFSIGGLTAAVPYYWRVRELRTAATASAYSSCFSFSVGGVCQAAGTKAACGDSLTITGPASGTPNPVASNAAVNLSVTAVDALGHPLSYRWNAICVGLGGGGSFSNSGDRVPTWAAPINSTGSPQACAIQVVVSNDIGLSQTSIYNQRVMPVLPTTSPTVTILAPTTAPTFSTSSSPIVLSGSAADPQGVSAVTWSNDRGGTGVTGGTNTGWTTSAIALQAGVNVLTVTATDPTGNSGTASLTVDFAPSPSVVTLATGLTNPSDIVVDDTSVYFSEVAPSGGVRKVGKQGGLVTNLASGFRFVNGMAVNQTDLYFADSPANNEGTINKVAKSGGSITQLAGGQASVGDVAVDSSSVYFTDPSGGTVRQVPLGGGSVSILASGQASPAGLAVDDQALYWTETANPWSLIKLPLNGSGGGLLASFTNTNGVTTAGTSVFWAENLFDHRINRISRSGGSITTLASGLMSPADIATDGINIYWVENTAQGAVRQVPVAGGTIVTLASGLAEPVALATDGTAVYWIERSGGQAGSGTVRKAAISGTPVSPPGVATTTAGGIDASNAVPNALVNPHGHAATAYFEIGTTTAYGMGTGAQPVGTGFTPIPVSQSVHGLACGTFYHFRAVGTNDLGTVPGNDETFSTSPCIFSTIYSETFANGLGGFHVDNTLGYGAGLWHATSSCAAGGGASGSTALYYGIDSQCNYDAGTTEGVAVSPVVQLPAGSVPLTLQVQYLLTTEGPPGTDAGFDAAMVEIATNGGAFVPFASNGAAGQYQRLADGSGAWTQQVFDLTPLAGSAVQLRFHFRTGDAVNNAHPGFYVSRVAIQQAPPAPAASFYTLTPCRLFDTRPLSKPVVTNEMRRIQVAGGGCGIPSTARAVSANVTIVTPSSDGFVNLYPGNSALPSTSIVNFRGGQVRANNAVLQLATDGSGTLALQSFLMAGGSVDVIIDVDGYFQ